MMYIYPIGLYDSNLYDSNINDIYCKYSNILILKHLNECNEYSDILNIYKFILIYCISFI